MDLGTQTHLSTLRNLLTFRLHDLQTEVNAAALDRDAGAGADREVTDLKEQAEQATNAEMDDAERERRLAELADVRLALERLDHGSYGDCIECGEAIPVQRLLVQPAAARCTTCQNALERGG
jgi:RNA polymerase-binding transcription factor DksA